MIDRLNLTDSDRDFVLRQYRKSRVRKHLSAYCYGEITLGVIKGAVNKVKFEQGLA